MSFTRYIRKIKTGYFNFYKNFLGFSSFYLVHYIISSSFISAGITQYPLSNRDPLWKFTVGLNHETRGGYSSADVEYVMSFKLGKEREAVEKKLIQERLVIQNKFYLYLVINSRLCGQIMIPPQYGGNTK